MGLFTPLLGYLRRLRLARLARHNHGQAMHILLSRHPELVEQPLPVPFWYGPLLKQGKAIHVASRFGSLDAILCLLDHGADPNRALYAGYSPIILAAITGQVEAMALLASRGADLASMLPTSGTCLEMWELDRPDAVETLRICNDGMVFRADAHAAWLALHHANRFEKAWKPATTNPPRPRL